MGDHIGVAKTLHNLQDNFFWPHMHCDVRHYVSECLIYQQTKYETSKPARLLQPLPIPASSWEDLSLDFIIGLLQSHGHIIILVIADRFPRAFTWEPFLQDILPIQTLYFFWIWFASFATFHRAWCQIGTCCSLAISDVNYFAWVTPSYGWVPLIT